MPRMGKAAVMGGERFIVIRDASGTRVVSTATAVEIIRALTRDGYDVTVTIYKRNNSY